MAVRYRSRRTGRIVSKANYVGVGPSMPIAKTLPRYGRTRSVGRAIGTSGYGGMTEATRAGAMGPHSVSRLSRPIRSSISQARPRSMPTSNFVRRGEASASRVAARAAGAGSSGMNRIPSGLRSLGRGTLIGGVLAAGAVWGVARGVRRTGQDINASAGNPVGFTARWSAYNRTSRGQ